MIGMICYRSRQEFDERFKWDINPLTDKFEIEDYLHYQGNKFARYYDPNCYLTLSNCMDRMNLSIENEDGSTSFEDGVLRIPNDKEIMLISYDTDYLIPPNELEKIGVILGSREESLVYYEMMRTKYGHDSFLISQESNQLNYRLKPFLEDGVYEVRKAVKDLF